MKKTNKIILYPFLFGVIFIIIPFALFIFTPIFKDFGFYILYAIFIFPFLLIIFLSVFIKKIKNKINNYKKIILWSISGYILTYFILFIYIYYLFIKAFRESSFPF